jgi:hypothetical protein
MTTELGNVSDAALVAELRRRIDRDPLLQGGLGREVLARCDMEAIWGELKARCRDAVLVMVVTGEAYARMWHTAAYAAAGLLAAGQRHIDMGGCAEPSGSDTPMTDGSDGESE